ncbi:MAG: helix-turn-helix domain-containing protein [Synergistaceae bacterium]|nr:helix-turn-helix domain-containing protein [Synergistaceae bacterium]
MHESSEKSYVEIANELGMKNPSHIAIWKMQYRQNGIEGLSKKRGGPSMVT